MRSEQIGTAEAFRLFDRDNDGVINKNDLLWMVQNMLRVTDVHLALLDRLYALMARGESGVSLEGLKRVIGDERPKTASEAPTDDVKYHSEESIRKAIRDIGASLSNNFRSVQESFASATQGQTKMNLEAFTDFATWLGCVKGGQIPSIFSAIDKRHRGHINEKDWISTFSNVVWKDFIFDEIRRVVAE